MYKEFVVCPVGCSRAWCRDGRGNVLKLTEAAAIEMAQDLANFFGSPYIVAPSLPHHLRGNPLFDTKEIIEPGRNNSEMLVADRWNKSNQSNSAAILVAA